MNPTCTYADQVEIDVVLVHRLVSTQFPQWADLPVRPVENSGWDNRTFRLGDHLSVRLPSAERYAPLVEKEHRWLSRLAPLLPLSIPVPLAMGVPGDDYPWHWSVYWWLEGENATIEGIADLTRFATTLVEFSPPCSGSMPPTGRPPASTTFIAARLPRFMTMIPGEPFGPSGADRYRGGYGGLGSCAGRLVARHSRLGPRRR
jgi:hypothetical protein